MAANNSRTTTTPDDLPFGAIAQPSDGSKPRKRRSKKPRREKDAAPADAAPAKPKPSPAADEGEGGAPPAADEESRRMDYRRQENRRGGGRRGGRRRSKRAGQDGQASDPQAPESPGSKGEHDRDGDGDGPVARGQVREAPAAAVDGAPPTSGRGRRRRKSRRGRGADVQQREEPRESAAPQTELTGMFVVDKGGFGLLRHAENQYLPKKDDAFVPKGMIQRWKLCEGSLVTAKVGRGHGQYKRAVTEIVAVDGKPPKEMLSTPVFKTLTSIDPDFHYALGNATGDVNMRIVDVICPVGRGTRGLIVAPPRSGKTILLQKFAQGIVEHYPDVHLFVLLVDERPEEATEWQRSVAGHVFVSTNDESPKNHVQLAEAVWKRCQRLVELGEDVVLLLDSITRLARAYNNFQAGSGRTMSGGLDTRTMEKPKQFFGCARNTETAGSLTILGTTLVETGSRMDQVIFEEFKGTGNMELVLARKLADRRIFPAIDIERSGTRKEEKLISSKQLKRVHTLRRVLAKMNFIEAMELLITKLEEVETNEEFLQRFEVDPEA